MNQSDAHLPDTVMIVPIYNESRRLNLVYWGKLVDIPGTHWIFIDDASTDSTRMKLSIFEACKNVTILCNQSNLGKSETVRKGINHIYTQGINTKLHLNQSVKYFGYIDADEAFDALEVDLIIQTVRLNGFKALTQSTFDLYWSSRVKLAGRNIQRKTHRHFIGRLINTIMGVLIKNLPYDSQCGFKIFRATSANKQVFAIPFKTKWLFDIEIFLRASSLRPLNEQNFLYEIPLETWKEVDGGSLGIRSALKIFKEVFLVCRQASMLKVVGKLGSC